ncbi:MAG: GGDEF domain-containing protein [Candidatus Izemoplasmatales bacterium]
MERVLYLYIYAIAILITILVSGKYQPQENYMAEKRFRQITILTLFMLLLDITHEHLNGIPGVFNAIILNIASILIFAVPSIIGLVWMSYLRRMLYRKPMVYDRWYLIVLIPFVLNIVLSILSVFLPIYFSIDSSNVYTRDGLYLLSIVLQYFYIIVPIFIVISKRNRINDNKFFPLIFFPVPPMIGGLIQAFNYGLLLIWPMLSLSLVILYIFVQSRMITIDYLTGLMNKGAFETYIENVNVVNKKGKYLSVTVIDLDGLKNINDNYGHLVGDDALSHFAENLMNSFGRNDYIARIGGDEFVVLKYVENKDEIQAALDNLNSSLEKISKVKSFPTEISFSHGSAIYDNSIYSSVKGLIEDVDRMMYESKAKKGRVHL